MPLLTKKKLSMIEICSSLEANNGIEPTTSGIATFETPKTNSHYRIRRFNTKYHNPNRRIYAGEKSVKLEPPAPSLGGLVLLCRHLDGTSNWPQVLCKLGRHCIVLALLELELEL